MVVVLASVRAKSFTEPVAFPPRNHTHFAANLVAVVYAESGNAMPVVETSASLHHSQLLSYLGRHVCEAGKLELSVREP